jgi:S-sulfo-L-cysteine synthase (O-acetyl-L-serine-dependent)
MWSFFIYNLFMQTFTDLFPEKELVTRVRSLEKQIGHTEMHKISSLFQKKHVHIYAKKEWMQLSGSVKARAAYYIIRAAIEMGELTKNRSLLDATSGNTGIAYATLGKLLNIRVVLCLPENASRERKEILRSLGAELILTSRMEGTDGAQDLAKAMSLDNPTKYFYADQYKNENNWKAHYYTTAPEIADAVPAITHFVAGLGTTGTFMGTGKRLKKMFPSIQLVSLQPDIALHGLEGWKHLETAAVPGIYDPDLADRNLEIATEEAYEIIRLAGLKEGLLLSPSSAANLAGAIRVAEGLDEGNIVTIFPDNADKYSEIINKIVQDDHYRAKGKRIDAGRCGQNLSG